MATSVHPDPMLAPASSIADALQNIARLLDRADRRVGEDHRVTWKLERTSHRIVSLINTGPDTAHEVHLYMTVHRSDEHGQSWPATESPRERKALVAIGESIDHALYAEGGTSTGFPVEVKWELTWQTGNGAPRRESIEVFVTPEFKE